MNNIVNLNGVSKKYQLGVLGAKSLRGALANAIRRQKVEGFWALRDISFNLLEGQSLGLVGPNGAGKSTILRLIAGITQPTEGDLQVNGRVASLLELGAGFHPELSGKENIYLYGSILGIKKREIQRMYDSIVDFSELEKFLDTPLKRYSSGMYVRLAFAVAAQLEPGVLLVDEVLAVGDAAFRKKCMDRMFALRKGGTSIIFVSHNSNMVRSICERAVYLQHGELVEQGPTEEVIKLYEKDVRRQYQISRPIGSSNEQLAGEEIIITAILVTDHHDIKRDWFEYDEGGKIKVEFHAINTIKSPIFHLRLWRDDGVSCFTVRSNQRDAPLVVESLEGQGYIALNLNALQLYGGNYRCEVAIVDSTNTLVLAMGYSDWFQVSGLAPNQENENLGVYVPHSSWEVSPGLPVLENTPPYNNEAEK